MKETEEKFYILNLEFQMYPLILKLNSSARFFAKKTQKTETKPTQIYLYVEIEIQL